MENQIIEHLYEKTVRILCEKTVNGEIEWEAHSGSRPTFVYGDFQLCYEPTYGGVRYHLVYKLKNISLSHGVSLEYLEKLKEFLLDKEERRRTNIIIQKELEFMSGLEEWVKENDN